MSKKDHYRSSNDTVTLKWANIHAHINVRDIYTKGKKVEEDGTGWASLPFNYCPLSPYAPPALLWDKRELWNWIAEHISTNKATLHLTANRGKDQHRDSDNTPVSEPDKFTNCWKENKSWGLNQKCSGAAEWTGKAGGIGALYDWSWFCALRRTFQNLVL